MSKVAVIGAGFSGIASATSLAQAGYDVTVYEKNATAGGRARKFEQDGFVFDMGPSWYWMPDVFERYFARFGKKVADYYSLVRLDPSYRVFFSKNNSWDIPANPDDLYAFFDAKEPGSGRYLKKFLAESKTKYDLGMNELVYKPGLSLSELLDTQLFKGIFKLHVFQSIRKYIRSYFTSPQLVQLLEFPVLFLGASPAHTPALYSLMNYADMVLGTWYPQGGMIRIVDGMEQLARETGVQFEFNKSVSGFSMNQTKVKSIIVNNQYIHVDYVVAGADYHHVEQELLPEPFRKYGPRYWNTRKLAPSSLIFYLGLNKKIEGLIHHNLFFDQDFEIHTQEIYDDPAWPTNPLFYVCCPSKTDLSVAPPSCENLFILIPVAPGLQDTNEVRDLLFKKVMSRLENIVGEKIEEHVVVKRSYAHRDFVSDYNAYKGNAYGLANTLLQTAHLKPSIINKKVSNLFYTGQLTVPGPGVPPSLVSGQVTAAELIKQHKNQLTKKTRN